MNKTIKKISVFIILVQIVSCDNFNKKEFPKIIVNARLIRSYDSTYIYQDTSKRKTFDIALSISNKSDKPIMFWLMDCSWDNNFLINNDYIYFNRTLCDHNYPRKVRIKQNDSLVLRTSINKYESSRYRTIETSKFGLIYVDTIACKNIHDFESIIGDKSKHDKVIWSNPLHLQDKK